MSGAERRSRLTACLIHSFTVSQHIGLQYCVCGGCDTYRAVATAGFSSLLATGKAESMLLLPCAAAAIRCCTAAAALASASIVWFAMLLFRLAL